MSQHVVYVDFSSLHNAEISFYFFLPFSISHSSVIHRKIYVKGFTGITTPRISKFGANFGYDHLYRARKNPHHCIYHSLYLSIFPLLQYYFSSKISL